MKKFLLLLLSCVACLVLGSCYYQQHGVVGLNADEETLDSLDFVESHHYSVGFNFVVHADTLSLCTEIPSRAQQFAFMPDSVTVLKDDVVIVADVETVPEDQADSIWIKVARDQETQGWIRESELLPVVSPDDPISLAIFEFSGNHVWGTVWLFLIVVLVVVIEVWNMHRRLAGQKRTGIWSYYFGAFRFSRVCSPYPWLLFISMAGSAVFYASMQLFAPEAWEEFYFHPTLNPFAVTPLLGAFLLSVWLMLIFFIAVVDDAFRQLSFGKALLYMLRVFTALALLYIFFSLTTLVYVGYPLFVLFVVFVVFYYFRCARPRFRCGKCGMPLHRRGVCPRCGAVNE